MNTPLSLPPVLESKLSDFRRRVWLVKLAEGLLAAVFGLALSYIVVFGLDRFFETPAWLRGTILVCGAAVLGLGLPLKWHRWVWRQRRLEDAARLLRWKFPRLGDQLLGIVELARRDDGTTGRSERLVQAAMDQAADVVKDQDFSAAVPAARHRQWGWAAGGVMALVVAVFALVNEAAGNAMLRWLMPWRETERYTFTRVDALPDPLVVPFAEPFDLPVTLAGDSRWQPESGWAHVTGQAGVAVTRAEMAYPFAFPPQKTDTELFVKVGDVRKTLRLQPRTRPELATLKAKLKLPAYLNYQTQPVLELRGGSLSILKGAEAVFEATASRALASAQMDGKALKVEGARLISPPTTVNAEQQARFTWVDELGLTPRDPLVLNIEAAEDAAPRIVARRETLEQVVLDSEVVVFDVGISDDFGIKRVGLEWRGVNAGGEPPAGPLGEKIAAAGQPEMQEMDTRATFCATREGVLPQTIEVRAWAEDYLPGRPRSYSATFVMHVLNRTDHALWITQQMTKWLESARETYEREQQLHQTNKELRAMNAGELDRPENRRRISQQATAENANAARLEALNQSGRNLVEQATKNPEFEAARLESWATMLKSLGDIASKRMPSVADLLKQSASAKTDPKLAASPSTADKPGGEKPGEAKSGEATPAGEPSEKQQPSAAQASAKPGQPGKPGQPPPPGGKSAPQVVQGPQPPPGDAKPKPVDPTAKPKDPAPSVKLTESTMNKPDPAGAEAKPGAPKPPGAGKLKLPTNSLTAAPGQKEPPPPDQPAPPASAAQEELEKGLGEQRDLLAEFARVTDQLNEILASLEASTFVKRFKAASRAQMELASGINQNTLDAFGISKPRAALKKMSAEEMSTTAEPGNKGMQENGVTVVIRDDQPAKAEPAAAEAEPVVLMPFATTARGTARTQSDVVSIIQSDLEAYSQRKPDQHFKRVLEEMKKVQVVRALAKVGEHAVDNLSGHAINGAEYWADTMDRWAEEMVAAGKASNCSSCKGDSLPPEIVLKVMQALRDEMKLRDETRELDKAKPAVDLPDYERRAMLLSAEQVRIAIVTQSAIDDVASLPNGPQTFQKELQLLTMVRRVMDEAGGLLETPDTGPKAIAAETEAIELLLQTKRQPPGGGGGGGGSPGGGGGAATASAAALSELGPGGDADSDVKARPVGQSTGRAGKEFPEEFKTGLDTYFNNLENQGGSQP